MKKKEINKRISVLILVSFFVLSSFNLAIAIPYQGHPGDEITGEITEAVVSCDKLQQSDITDDSDFCTDLDTRCDATFPCTTLCLGGVCINSFSEINATGGSADLADDSVTTDHILDGTITQADLNFTIEGGSGDAYCPDGTCSGDLYIPLGNHLMLDAGNLIKFMVGSSDVAGVVSFGGGSQIGLYTNGVTSLVVDADGKVRIGDTSVASPHSLGVRTNADDAVIDISSPAGEFSAVDFLEASTAKWGVGKDNSNNFYIDETGVTPSRLKILSTSGNVGIGVASPTEKLDIDGNVVASGSICDSYGCISWTPIDSDIYFDSGNVGIGTTNPQDILHIEDDSSPTISVRDTTSNLEIGMQATDTDGRLGVFSNHDLWINAGVIGRIRILKNGNVGIGVSNPDEKLHVAGNLRVDGRIKDETGPVTPVGTILPYAGASATVPEGWLLCDGKAYSSSGTYSDLFDIIGTNFGNGNTGTGGTTGNFNVPDLRGQFLRGVDDGAGDDPDADLRPECFGGGNSGDNVGSCQADAFQGHYHDVTYNDANMGNRERAGGTADTSADNQATITIGSPTNDGSSGEPRTSSETRPINVYVNFIIKY